MSDILFFKTRRNAKVCFFKVYLQKIKKIGKIRARAILTFINDTYNVYKSGENVN